MGRLLEFNRPSSDGASMSTPADCSDGHDAAESQRAADGPDADCGPPQDAATRSRIASWAGSGTQTAASSPARCSLARLIASRRPVLIPSPGLRGSMMEPRQRTHARPGSTAVEPHSRKGRPRSRTEARFQRATASPPSVYGRRRVRDLPILAHILLCARLRKRDRDLSLCTSRPTYVRNLSKTRLLCMRLGAGIPAQPSIACIL